MIIEAIGEAGRLIESVKALTPVLQDIGREISRADANLRETLASFEARMTAIIENAKTKAVQHVATRTEEAARRSVDLQARVMADAAHVAFGAEVGTALQRLQALGERPGRRWESWLTHAAAAATASAATWTLAIMLWAR